MSGQLSRRRLMQGVMSFLALSAIPMQLFARAKVAFEATEKDIVYKELFGDLPIVESADIKMKIPDIAENGAVVPITISTDIEGVKSIFVIIDSNPNPLSASFHMSPSSPADISVRIKMGKSSLVRAMVKTSDKVYMTSKEVKVTIGGCGG
ncbi:MAG: thiosulfate oxidation carrier protein SoxY [Pseudomonadales bacterium]|nr:thiosulfate oxidation carrier protein SoxY [Pseudomonadales bacterium]